MKNIFGILSVLLMLNTLVSADVDPNCEGITCEIHNFGSQLVDEIKAIGDGIIDGFNNIGKSISEAIQDAFTKIGNYIVNSSVGQFILTTAAIIAKIWLFLLGLFLILPMLVFMAVFILELLFIVSSFSQRGSALHQFGVFMFYNYRLVMVPVAVISSTLGWAVNKL